MARPPATRASVEARFWSTVNKVTTSTGEEHWYWTGRAIDGVPAMSVAGQMVNCARIAWELEGYGDTTGYLVGNRCGDRLCIRPHCTTVRRSRDPERPVGPLRLIRGEPPLPPIRSLVEGLGILSAEDVARETPPPRPEPTLALGPEPPPPPVRAADAVLPTPVPPPAVRVPAGASLGACLALLDLRGVAYVRTATGARVSVPWHPEWIDGDDASDALRRAVALRPGGEAA